MNCETDLAPPAPDQAEELMPNPSGLLWEIDEDGGVFNPETGEYYEPNAIPAEALADLQSFHEVRDRQAAEFALERRTYLESQLAACNLRLRSVQEGIGTQIRQLQRRLQWWDVRFEASIVRFAKTQLKGKGKTAQFDNGKVSFRAVPETIEVIDDAAALEWAAAWAPDKIQHKAWITKTAVKDAIQAIEEEKEQPLTLSFVAKVPARESVSIKTGVEK